MQKIKRNINSKEVDQSNLTKRPKLSFQPSSNFNNKSIQMDLKYHYTNPSSSELPLKHIPEESEINHKINSELRMNQDIASSLLESFNEPETYFKKEELSFKNVQNNMLPSSYNKEISGNLIDDKNDIISKTSPISPPFTPVNATPEKSVQRKLVYSEIGDQMDQVEAQVNSFSQRKEPAKSMFANIFLSSSDQKQHQEPKEKDDCLKSDFSRWQGSLIFETPKKPKGSNSKTQNSFSCVKTAITTSSSTPHQPKRGEDMIPSINQAMPPSPENQESNITKRAMIVDEWAINTENEVKTNIIMNEFFKMIRPKENPETKSNEGSTPRKMLKFDEL